MKSILITGANRGIGLGLVKSLVEQTERDLRWIVATCRKPAESQELNELAAKYSSLQVVQFDLANFDSYSSVASHVGKIVGRDGLNVLVNNAGVSGRFRRLDYMKPAHMFDAFTVNTIGPLMLTKELMPLLKTAVKLGENAPIGVNKACIINVSSILGSSKLNTTGGLYSYRCSKAALNSWTKTLSVELKDAGILVVAVHPGWIKTELGGPHAPLTVEKACSQLVELFYSLNETQHGKFIGTDLKDIEW